MRRKRPTPVRSCCRPRFAGAGLRESRSCEGVRCYFVISKNNAKDACARRTFRCRGMNGGVFREEAGVNGGSGATFGRVVRYSLFLANDSRAHFFLRPPGTEHGRCRWTSNGRSGRDRRFEAVAAAALRMLVYQKYGFAQTLQWQGFLERKMRRTRFDDEHFPSFE